MRKSVKPSLWCDFVITGDLPKHDWRHILPLTACQCDAIAKLPFWQLAWISVGQGKCLPGTSLHQEDSQGRSSRNWTRWWNSSHKKFVVIAQRSCSGRVSRRCRISHSSWLTVAMIFTPFIILILENSLRMAFTTFKLLLNIKESRGSLEFWTYLFWRLVSITVIRSVIRLGLGESQGADLVEECSTAHQLCGKSCLEILAVITVLNWAI